MTKVIEAIYTNGHLEPVEPLDLEERQRVRLVLEPVQVISEAQRQAALDRLLAHIAQMNFRSGGPYPTRDELHERG